MIKRLICCVLLALPLVLPAQPGPARTKAQVASWEAMKYGMFIHFNMNTYAGVEYDNGTLPASAFAPDALDVDQWIRTARDAGMKYAVLTAKHTGGFCLWDSKVQWKGKEYDYDVAASPCNRDVVALFMAACTKYGVKPALYYCLWDDHNQKGSTKEEYFNLTYGHVNELVTNYQGLVEIWIDIPSQLEPAQRKGLYDLVKQKQPGCLVTCNNGFTDGTKLLTFPTDITNGERTLPPAGGHEPLRKVDSIQYYIPMEVCQTINQNWFWMPGDVTKSVRTLYHWYDQTVKRGANLLLDVPPDKSGRIPQLLADRLVELRQVIENPEQLAPATSLTAYRPVSASSLWGGNRVEYSPEYGADQDPNTRWMPRTDDPEPSLTIDLGGVKRFNSLTIMEPYESHIKEFEVFYQLGNEWISLLKGTGIGPCLHRQFPDVESGKVKLVVHRYTTGPNPGNVNSFPATPPPVEGVTIAEFQVYYREQRDDPDFFNSFLAGREYFFLRSGDAKLILQADKAGTLPAFTSMLFNAEIPSQTGSKRNSINYVPGTNFSASAAEVILGKVSFTALPHNSSARWITSDSLPAVECSWWAGGVRVTETWRVSRQPGTFKRTIKLTSSDLAGNDTARVRLSVPPGVIRREAGTIRSENVAGIINVAAMNLSGWRSNEEEGWLESPPLALVPGGSVTLNTLLRAEFPTVAGKSATDDFGWQQSCLLSAINTDDTVMSRLYQSASFALPGMVAKDGRMDAGVFEYGNQWVRDGSNVAMGLIYSGAFESARGLLDYILSDLVADEGTTVIAGGFDEPDREEFDQMGVLMNCLKLYLSWTGDSSLLKGYSRKIVALVERPLNKAFRDSTGMVHNRREFWERTFSDAYELAYQTYMIQGLRDAAELAPILGVPERSDYWRHEADVFLNAMLHHPNRSLVVDGALIKRRNVTGEPADLTTGRQPSYKNDAPTPSEFSHRLNPDATYALPILLGIIDPHSALAHKSLDKLESIWNARWDCGGYERYHSSSQIDQPGPWTFGTAFIARAQHEAGLTDRSRRSVEWLHDIQGGNAGAWFEEIPLNRSQVPWCGIVPWTSAEVASFTVRHWLGVRIEGNHIIIRPNLFRGTTTVTADLRFRNERLNIFVDKSGKKPVVTVNGRQLKADATGDYRVDY